jgi:hypothetical protein
MRNKSIQCKHIPDIPILTFLLEHSDGPPCHWFFGQDRDVSVAMPLDTPRKLVLSKMQMLIRRGLVDGCGCGCRGDFEITEKGKILLGSADGPLLGESK